MNKRNRKFGNKAITIIFNNFYNKVNSIKIMNLKIIINLQIKLKWKNTIK
jgi:hypothetical protein